MDDSLLNVIWEVTQLDRLCTKTECFTCKHLSKKASCLCLDWDYLATIAPAVNEYCAEHNNDCATCIFDDRQDSCILNEVPMFWLSQLDESEEYG